MNFPGLTDSIATIAEQLPVCPLCGTDARISGGSCLSCLLRAGLDEAAVETEDFDDVLSEIEIRDSDWRLGNYQILEEIGRGGMGVIYRARQRHSKRIVALKRVLNHHVDSRETLERFRREAQAVASLDHPNVLPIYEVSECEGQPFFTMKYATGGSLQQAAPALRTDERECVRVVAKVTRAVAYAHREGILHRDLKPGNILLDGRGEPLVSDFGLAKWMDANSDLTRSLAVFGTPGFIAPEQAQGPRAEVAPAADIYSLGAILFDLLTGRPPFLGEHALAVIRQAAEKPAPKLRGLVPNADCDLETICAKCLEREPHLRYRSASDLAEDLERWLEGRSIVARPVAAPVRCWRWAKRNPTLACSVAAGVILAAVGFAGWATSSRFEAIVERNDMARRSVTVVPFEDLDAHSEQSSLAKSVTGAIEGQFAATKGIHLRPFPAGTEARNNPGTRQEHWKEIGQAANARLIVSGSVRARAERYRLATHLIDSATGGVVSTSLLDLDSIDQFGPQLVSKIVQHLNEKEVASENVTETGSTTNPEARSYYERGKELFFRYNLPDLDRAIGSAREALELDSNYAQAHALFANACQLRSILEPEAHWLEEAGNAAQKALSIAPLLPDAHRAAAGTLQRRGHFKASVDSYLTAYELDPGNALTAALVGTTYEMIGRPDLAIWWLERAMQRENRPIYADNLGDAFVSLGEFEAAADQYRTAAIFRPDLPVESLGLSRIALMRGDFEGARAEIAKARSNHPNNPQPLIMAALIEFFSRNFTAAESFYREALAFGRNGGVEFTPGSVGFLSALGFISRNSGVRAEGDGLLAEALAANEKKLAEAPGNSFYLYSLAANRAAMEEKGPALEALDRAIAAGWIDHYSLMADPRFDCVRDTQNFQAQLTRLRQNVRDMALRRRDELPVAAR